MQSAVHRLASPIADPAQQLPVISKAPAQPPGTLGRLPAPLRPIIPPAGSAHSDPFPMVPQRLQGPKPYSPQETQSDLGGYGLRSIPYLAEPLLGPVPLHLHNQRCRSSKSWSCIEIANVDRWWRQRSIRTSMCKKRRSFCAPQP